MQAVTYATLRAATALKVVHAFKGPPKDGAGPESGLIDVDGTLYGTTSEGGAHGFGSIFKIESSGAETLLYSFAGGSDGAFPNGSLVALKGTMYGTTAGGGGSGCGGSGCGTVFSVTPSGTEKNLYDFKGAPSDGSAPEAGLLNVGGVLFGTTSEGGGGGSGYGTVFRITTSGAENVVYNFAGGSAWKRKPAGIDAANPYAAPIDVDGVLYGTTVNGGLAESGTVYSVTTYGKETVVHSFAGGSGGTNPYGALVNVGGTLYGTTTYGGTGCKSNLEGCGTVFSMTADGEEKTIYAFQGGSDGQYPYAGLVEQNGMLYGTTEEGGATGNGTVVQLTTRGAEKVIYAFKGGTDGGAPFAPLTAEKGTLFGAASLGGGSSACHSGCGTAFSLR